MNDFVNINEIIEKIENLLREKLLVGEIASKFYISEFHFHRKFKNYTGYSLISYIRKRKMNSACNELLNTDKKIIEIAFEYGYASNEAFTRAMKKESGFTPSCVRKKCIKNIGVNKFEKI